LPISLDVQTSAGACFAKTVGMAIDSGHTHQHVHAQDRGETRVIDRYRVGRSEVQVLAGQVRDLVSAEVQVNSGSRTKSAQILVHSPSCASVVVPRSMKNHEGWPVVLTDSSGTAINVANSDRSNGTRNSSCHFSPRNRGINRSR